MIIVVTGLPGSGKSYFAQQLAPLMDAEYINSDKVRSLMSEAATQEYIHSAIYEQGTDR